MTSTPVHWPTIPAPSAYMVAGRIAEAVRDAEAKRRLPNRMLLHETPERVRDFYTAVSAGRDPAGYEAAEKQKLYELAEASIPPIVLSARVAAPVRVEARSGGATPKGDPTGPEAKVETAADAPRAMTEPQAAAPAPEPERPSNAALEIDRLIAAAEEELLAKFPKAPAQVPAPGWEERRREAGATAEPRDRRASVVVSPRAATEAPRRKAPAPVSPARRLQREIVAIETRHANSILLPSLLRNNAVTLLAFGVVVAGVSLALAEPLRLAVLAVAAGAALAGLAGIVVQEPRRRGVAA